jgi:hypothetical protein
MTTFAILALLIPAFAGSLWGALYLAHAYNRWEYRNARGRPARRIDFGGLARGGHEAQ